MDEKFLHFIWLNQQFTTQSLKTIEGKSIMVVQKGLPHQDAGPDFQNGKIIIGDTVWAGHIEIHVRASDWYDHQHHKDEAYQNVILHVVYENDKDVLYNNGQLIPTLVLKPIIDLNLYFDYEQMLKSRNWIPCMHSLPLIDRMHLNHWLDRMLITRLEIKTKRIDDLLRRTNQSWEEAFYVSVSRYFGSKINDDAFEWLAFSLPLRVLAKHKHQLLQIEALMYGQAGLLDEDFKDDYPNNLKKEYAFLRQKHGLTPLKKSVWKFLRLRPAAFPTLRIAQLSMLIHQSTHLFSKILEAADVKSTMKLFETGTSAYWETHFQFDKLSAKRTKKLGRQTIVNILINTIIPFLFYYGQLKQYPEHKEKAFSFLGHLPPESNSIITKWKGLIGPVESAYQTQALLTLKTDYCDQRKCLECEIGNRILRKRR
jgi:Protein of unknown function (DUF2851)